MKGRPSNPIRAYAEANGIPLDVAYCAADGILADLRGQRYSYWQLWGVRELDGLSLRQAEILHLPVDLASGLITIVSAVA